MDHLNQYTHQVFKSIEYLQDNTIYERYEYTIYGTISFNNLIESDCPEYCIEWIHKIWASDSSNSIYSTGAILARQHSLWNDFI